MDYCADFNKIEIENGTYFDAIYHSYNPRDYYLYYIIKIYKENSPGAAPIKEFGIRIIERGSPKESSEQKRASVLRELKSEASKGKTNIPKSILWR